MQATAMVELFDDELVQKLADSRRELLDEYRQPHDHPWIIGYSGGKDSTLVVHLVFEMLMDLPRSERLRRVHVVANDTLVESPLVVGHIKATMARFDEAAALRLSVETRITAPKLDHGRNNTLTAVCAKRASAIDEPAAPGKLLHSPIGMGQKGVARNARHP